DSISSGTDEPASASPCKPFELIETCSQGRCGRAGRCCDQQPLRRCLFSRGCSSTTGAMPILSAGSQWPSEAKLVAIRIGQVKEPLAPFGIAGRRVWSVAGRDHPRIEGVDVGMVEDDTSPPRPISLRGLCDEIEKAGSGPKTCKRGVITTMNDLKSQHAIEGDGAHHVVGGQRDGTDALNHRGIAPTFGFTTPGSGTSCI